MTRVAAQACVINLAVGIEVWRIRNNKSRIEPFMHF